MTGIKNGARRCGWLINTLLLFLDGGVDRKVERVLVVRYVSVGVF